LIDGLQGTSSGIVRGCGKQALAAYANIFAFYVVGLPCAYAFCFKFGFGVNGLLFGLSIGTFLQVLFLLSFIFLREEYLFSPVIKGGEEPVIATIAAIGKDDVELPVFSPVASIEEESGHNDAPHHNINEDDTEIASV